MKTHSHSKLAVYGFAAFPLAALTLPVQIFLPTFYAQNLGLGLASVGIILLIARMIDVFSDPIIGQLSDQTHSKFGRRKPWIFGGLPIVMLAAWFLLVPSGDVSALYLLSWSIVLYIGWSAMILPLNAWGAELSDDYHERTIISAWREGFTVAGILGALSLIAAFSAGNEERKALYLIAISVLILLPIATALALFFVPDQKTEKKAPIAFKKGLKILSENQPFRRLILAYLINALANGFPATLFLFYVQYGLEMNDQAGPLLFIYFLCGVLAVPFWTWLSKKYGKHKTWCFAMLWACAFFLLVPFVEAGDYTFFLIICILTGASLGADLTLPASMQADVVDIDRKETGERRTGLYFALWSMVTKMALALAAGIAFPMLNLFGFAADSGGNIMVLVALYAIVPVALKLVSICLMWTYPLDETRMDHVHKKIT